VGRTGERKEEGRKEMVKEKGIEGRK